MVKDKTHGMCDKSLTDFGLPPSNKNNSNNNMNPLEEALLKPYDLNKLSEYTWWLKIVELTKLMK